jgi:hypothetical protein
MFFDKVGRWPLFLFDVVRTGRAKEPKPEAQEPLALQITAPLVEARIRDVEAIDAQINAGLFPRRPSPMNCNKCVYKHACWWGILPPKTEAPPAPAVERDLTPVLETSLAQAQAANGKQLELVGKA